MSDGEIWVDAAGDATEAVADFVGDAADTVGEAASDLGDAPTFWDCPTRLRRLRGHCQDVPQTEYEAVFYAAQDTDPAGVGPQIG